MSIHGLVFLMKNKSHISLMCFLNFWYLIVIKVTVNIFFGLGTQANMDDFSLCTRLFFFTDNHNYQYDMCYRNKLNNFLLKRLLYKSYIHTYV